MNKKTISIIFITIMAGCLAATLYAMLKTHGGALHTFLFIDPSDTFMDFFNPLDDAKLMDPYQRIDIIYPPICYTFYFLISWMMPALQKANAYELRESHLGMFYFGIYMVITSLLLIKAVYKLLEGSKYRETIAILMLISAPFLFLYERANIILFALVFLSVFVIYKDDERPWVRELAYLALGFSFAIKLYPAIFGLFLLKDKKWFPAVRCAIFGFIFLIVPFAWMGGFDKIPAMVHSLVSGAQNTMNLDFGTGYKINYSNFIAMVYSLRTGTLAESYFAIGTKISYIVCAICFVAAVLIKEDWKVSACLAAIMIGLPGFSFEYTMIFMIIPLAQFLKKERFYKIDVIYVILFAALFAMLSVKDLDLRVNPVQGMYFISPIIVMESTALFVMPLLITVESFIRWVAGRKSKKNDAVDSKDDAAEEGQE